MRVRQILPHEAEVEVESVLDRLTHPANALEPFSGDALEFASELSRELFGLPEGQSFPALWALAYWTRKAELARLKREFELLNNSRTVLVPRGIVFHIPPGNVDTIFIYSWLISLLTGNLSVVRLSDRSESPQIDAILRVLVRILPKFPRVQNALTILRYGHDAEINQALSSVADVRMIWGGDATVSRIRGIGSAPHCKDLAFADRFSFCVLRAQAVLSLEQEPLYALTERFFNDAYWFDQMGCASPRLMVWSGQESEVAEASARFAEGLGRVIRLKGYSTSTANAISKLTSACRAVLDGPVTRYDRPSNELTLVTLGQLAPARGEHVGGGFFYQCRVEHLNELAPFVKRHDQTLTHFGFPEEEPAGAGPGALWSRHRSHGPDRERAPIQPLLGRL